jgi:hypothetical protein
MRVTPINMAEAIIEPFWDPAISGLNAWAVEDGADHGLRVWQNWCWVNVEWARRPDRLALRMSRAAEVDCAAYDTLLLSAMLPEGAVLRLMAETDTGACTATFAPAGTMKREYALPLEGAARIHRLTIALEAGTDGVALGWFNWISLQDTALLARYTAEWARFAGERWEGYLKPEDFQPTFTPRTGILITTDELTALRARHAAALAAQGSTPFTQAAAEAAARVPETMVRDFVNFWGDTRYCRERDHGNQLLGRGPIGYGAQAAIAGVLQQDAGLLRLAARYALALAMCGHWDDGMITNFPAGTFDHRCFVQSLCLHECATILELAGEYLTDLGRDLIMRRMAEEGVGTIAYNTWKYEYIFHCNQLAWFTPGRMLGSAVLEHQWPRVAPYTDLAYADLVESLGYAILPDGGYVEGPTYFRCVGRDGGLSLYYYARARGLSFPALIPEPMKRTADFAAAIASTDTEKDVIPICDAGNRLDTETLAVMAAALPDSMWVTIYRKAVARLGHLPDTLLACTLDAEIPATGPEPPAFTFLPEMGVMASTRRLGESCIKLFLPGNKAGAGHTHEDKGSFILEFAGETFAMDPGSTDYSSPLSGLLQHCERHNMLVPTGLAERPHPRCPLPVDVKPAGHGDATAFHAAIALTPGWEPYYRRWTRTWDAPTPETLTITDTWELAQGNGVEFYWQTRLPVTVDGRNITLHGRHGTATITAPADTTVRVDELPLLDGVQRRVAIRNEAAAGEMIVRVRLAQ